MKLLPDLLALLPETIRKLDPRHAAVVLLWVLTLAVVVFILTGCGSLNYQPLESTTIKIENKERTNETP